MMEIKALEKAFDANPNPTLLIEANAPLFTIRTVNDAFLDMVSLKRTEVLGSAYAELCDVSAEIRSSRDAFNLVVSKGQSCRRLEGGMNITAYPISGAGESVDLVVLQLTGELTSERVTTEIKHIPGSSLDLFDFSPVAMWVYDVETLQILAANKAALADYGYTQSELLNATVSIFWPEDEIPIMEEMIATRVRRNLENKGTVRHVKKSGEIIVVNVHSTPLPSWGPNARIVAATDVSIARRTMELDQLDKNFLTQSAKEDIPFKDVLHEYLSGIEQQFPGMSCSLMRIKNGKYSYWAAPSLPQEIRDASKELSVDMDISAGNAGVSGQSWSTFHSVVSDQGFKGYLHHPIYNSKREIIAAFDVYHRRFDELPPEESDIMERIVALLKVILEKRQYSKLSKEITMIMLESQELAQFGNWSWELDSDILFWSENLYPIFGQIPESFKPTFNTYLHLVHEDDRQMMFDVISGLLTNGQDAAFEERIIRPDGEIRYLRSWAKAIRNASGDVAKIIGACLDITESKKAQNELLASKAALQKLLDRYLYVNKATNDAIYDWDIDVDLIEWGESFNRVFGYRMLPLKQSLNDWFKLLHPDDAGNIRLSLKATISRKDQSRWSAGFRIRRENGEYVDVEENGYILRNGDGSAKRMIGVVRDITERRKAEEALKLSNDRYADLFQLSPLPLWVYDPETLKILDVNKAAVEHYGYSHEEFLSLTLLDIRPPEDVPVVKEIIRSIVDSGAEHTGFSRHLTKNGKLILVNTRGTLIRYKGGHARMVVAIDNSERIRAEEALLRSERRFKTMIQEGSDLIAILDRMGNISYISPNIQRLFNSAPADMILTNPFDYIHEEDQSLIKQQLLMIEENQTIKIAPYRVKLKGGEIRWLETIITNKTKDPAIEGIIANSRDISARMKSILKNKKLLDRYNAVSKATSDAIWDSNIQAKQILWNHSISDIFGYEEMHTSLDWWSDHVHPEDVGRVTELIEAHLNSGQEKWTCEYRFRCIDGDYKTVLDRGFIIYSDNGQPVRMIGCMQDITARVEYVHAIEQHNERLREIAWMQSHLVRAPLARILGITQILSTVTENSHETLSEMLPFLSSSALELDTIIKDIVRKSQNLQQGQPGSPKTS